MEMSYNLNDVDINLDEIEKALMDLKKRCEDAIVKMNDELNNPSNWPFLDRLFAKIFRKKIKIEERCPYINTNSIDKIIKDIKEFKEANGAPQKISLRADTLDLHYYDAETGDEVTTKWGGLVVRFGVVNNVKINKPIIIFKLVEESYGIDNLWTSYMMNSILSCFLNINLLLCLKKKITTKIPVFERIFVEIKIPAPEGISQEEE